jgi:hypothetical protein
MNLHSSKAPTHRSRTYYVNTVTHTDKKGKQTTVINLFIDGIPEDAVTVPGFVPIGKALMYIGTRLLMEGQ